MNSSAFVYDYIQFLLISGISDVHCEHLVASIGISDRQKGHSFVVASFSGTILFTCLIIIKMTKEIMKKLSNWLINKP